MARIDVLPSIEIIRGLKGILDFYVWRGLPCVRAWPRYRPARQTAASLAAALTFGAIVKAYSLLGNVPLEAYRQDALDQPRTARDIMVTGVYGNLHEASMSDFLTLLVECRDFLSDLTALLNALDSIATDELVVNVDQSVLPPLAATTTNQTTQITALQKLDDLQDALESKALDRLLVRGMDQLFAYKDTLNLIDTGNPSGAGGFMETPAVPPGQIHIATAIAARDRNTALTSISFMRHHAGTDYIFHEHITAYAAWQILPWAGTVYLKEGDTIRAQLIGSLAGDNCDLWVLGHIMTPET